MTTSVPELRWGVVGTGWIASMFVTDLLRNRPDAPAKHAFTAIGSSSVAKGEKFWTDHMKELGAPLPTVHDTYQAVYESKDVDIVYIATPHALHHRNCLDAIAAGKHVLVEKPFSINAKEAEEVVEAAKAKGVFLMEAVWTRFFPMMRALQEKIQAGVIGRVRRTFLEIGLSLNWAGLSKDSRLKDPALGGGALLDICIYPLTFASLILGDGKVGDAHRKPSVTSTLTVVDGVDESDVVALRYKADDGFEQSAICLATVHSRQPPEFGRIEGTEGSIILRTDKGPSCPNTLTIKTNEGEEVFRFDHPSDTMGFIYEADAVAADIAQGKLQNDTMPLAESLRMMRLMDEIRQQSGLVYPQDQK